MKKILRVEFMDDTLLMDTGIPSKVIENGQRHGNNFTVKIALDKDERFVAISLEPATPKGKELEAYKKTQLVPLTNCKMLLMGPDVKDVK